MDKAASRKRGIVFRVLTVLALVLLGAAYFQPGWWVSLTAPNYPEATFPQGIRILFHMDSVQNGCDIRASQEVEETEALDCVHEMDTINHYVGMYPIASGGPVEGTKCYWKRTGADGAIIDNALSGKPQVVTIEATDATFKTSGCQPWTLTDQAPPPENSPQMSQWQLRQYLNNLNSLAGQSGNGQLPPF